MTLDTYFASCQKWRQEVRLSCAITRLAGA